MELHGRDAKTRGGDAETRSTRPKRERREAETRIQRPDKDKTISRQYLKTYNVVGVAGPHTDQANFVAILVD